MLPPGVALGATIAVLLAATLLGVWYARGRVESLEAYVSANDTAAAPALTASLAASALGTWILFSPAEAAVSFGGIPAVLGYALGMALPLAVFAPFGVRIRRLVPHGHSVTEYVLARYGHAMYLLVLGVSGAYMFVFLAVELTGIAAALSIVAEVPAPVTATLVGAFVFLYTGYGGLVASIVTDTLQTLVMLPLLAVTFAGILLSMGGPTALHAQVSAADPSLLALDNAEGVRFGVYVGLALLGANVLNQGLWQRVYAAEDDQTVRRSFLAAAVAVVPVIVLSGLFGLDAVGLGVVEDGGHAAFFESIVVAAPDWVAVGVVVVAVLLVMTTVDTLLSGLASLALHDLPRVVARLEREDHDSDDLLAARVLTGLLALAAVAIAAVQVSEIELFLTVDLLCAATFVPVVLGVYTGEIPEWGALAASATGFAAGLAFDPVARHLLLEALPAGLLPQESFTASFLAAVAVALAVTASAAAVSSRSTDLDRLGSHVRGLDEEGAS